MGDAGVADVADPLAGHDAVALVDERGALEVHVGVVDVGAVAVDDDVVARARLEGLAAHDAAARGDERRAAGGEDVVALVRVAGAAGAEARDLRSP